MGEAMWKGSKNSQRIRLTTVLERISFWENPSERGGFLMRKKRIVGLCVFFLGALITQLLCAHYRPEQYVEAEKGLSSVVSDLSTHLNTLESIAAQVEGQTIQDKSIKYRAVSAVEIFRHHAMRAWYNRLLLQNLSDEAVSLGQMSTIVRMSMKPLSNGIYQISNIAKEEDNEALRQAYNRAMETMRSLLTLYEQALGNLKSVIRTDD
jgi:hypothetical protein